MKSLNEEIRDFLADYDSVEEFENVCQMGDTLADAANLLRRVVETIGVVKVYEGRLSHPLVVRKKRRDEMKEMSGLVHPRFLFQQGVGNGRRTDRGTPAALKQDRPPAR